MIELSVEDTGIGIPQDKLSTIFEVFSQADQSTTRKFGGTGLGLAICRRIAAAMGGDIEVSSTLGVGSTFRVRIPTGASTSQPWPMLEAKGSQQPVCVIDVSGEATASALSHYFGAFGYAITQPDAGLSDADYRSAAMICVDADRLHQRALGKRPDRTPIVLAVTRFGDEASADVITGGLADAAISRPLLRSEIEELLRRVAAGESVLQVQAASSRRDGALPRFDNLRVLVADDNAVNREVAIEALSRLGAQVETVENGTEAVKAASKRSHDIIFMDGSMPQMDGFTAARIIRQAEKLENRQRIPIVALTAHVIGAATEEWRLAGMDAVIHKPFTIAQLAECLADQVPQFQTPTSDRTKPEDSGQAEDTAEAGSADAIGTGGAPLVDPAVLAQLRIMNETKKHDFLKRVVEIYSEHAPKACDQLRQHAKANEAEACGAVAHSIKSMSLNIGAVEVAKIAADFEQAARGNAKVPEQDAIDALENMLQQTLAVLADEIEQTDGGPRVNAAGPASPSLTASPDRLEKDLHLAIERREFNVEYQPFVDRSGRQVLGLETLVRWRRGGVEDVPSSVFVPIAERTGFIDEMGEWVLRQACKDALAWPTLIVAVNISPIQFRRPGLADRIERILSEVGRRPQTYRA